MWPDTSLSALSPAIGAGLSGPGKHRAGRKVILRQLMARVRSKNLSECVCGEDVSLLPGGKREEARPQDRKAAKGLRPTKAWSRPLRCPDSCATAVATGVESLDAEGLTSSST
ncbi:hypothetical protein RF11_08168 [Thelohanellus kitauei]|uniref:Uncharacterized protein n=1 Tax=Thelohanellus kitauei TaxID=669202 RepID=A0A0C2JUE5_THEKT|nr:hypothetical protein RF11_08168 [Thelohanellus kitauei]